MTEERFIPSGWELFHQSPGLEILLRDFEASVSDEENLSLLAPDELTRYRSYRVTMPARRYLGTRIALRRLLGARCGLAPQEIQFDYGPQGKPTLNASQDLHFNLSHSSHFSAIAIAPHPIGLDIEVPRPIELSPQFLKLILSPREIRLTAPMSERQLREWFYQCWVIKEALLKANGLGLASGMNNLDPGITPPGPARFTIQHPLLGSGSWQVERISHPELQIVVAQSGHNVG